MSETKPKCPACERDDIAVFNRMFFQTTEVKRVAIGYQCRACNHKWQVYQVIDDAHVEKSA